MGGCFAASMLAPTKAFAVFQDRVNMLVKVEFASFAVDPGNNTPLIILRETGGNRLVPVPIGPLEFGTVYLE